MEKKKKLNEKQEKNPENKQEKKLEKKSATSRVFYKIIVKVVIFLIIFALGAGTFFFISRNFSRFFQVKKENKSALVEQQLSFCQELVTIKYRYSDIITIKKSSGFAKSYSIVKYTGLIRVGIADFTNVSYNLSADEKTVKIRLPKCEILGNDIFKQEIFDEKQSIFVPISTQEIFEEIDSARKDIQANMIFDGVLEEGNEYAKKIITQLMLSAGFEEVLFVR